MWDELDRGVEADEVFEMIVSRNEDLRDEIMQTVEHIDQCMGKKDYAIPWIQELQGRGYQVLYLSNYSPFVTNAKPEVLDFVPYMDGGIFSSDVKLIKPDEAIYQALFDKYNLDPQNCVFLDDTLPNILTAQKLGLHTIHFKNYGQAKAELEQLLAE